MNINKYIWIYCKIGLRHIQRTTICLPSLSFSRMVMTNDSTNTPSTHPVSPSTLHHPMSLALLSFLSFGLSFVLVVHFIFFAFKLVYNFYFIYLLLPYTVFHSLSLSTFFCTFCIWNRNTQPNRIVVVFLVPSFNIATPFVFSFLPLSYLQTYEVSGWTSRSLNPSNICTVM